MLKPQLDEPEMPGILQIVFMVIGIVIAIYIGQVLVSSMISAIPTTTSDGSQFITQESLQTYSLLTTSLIIFIPLILISLLGWYLLRIIAEAGNTGSQSQNLNRPPQTQARSEEQRYGHGAIVNPPMHGAAGQGTGYAPYSNYKDIADQYDNDNKWQPVQEPSKVIRNPPMMPSGSHVTYREAEDAWAHEDYGEKYKPKVPVNLVLCVNGAKINLSEGNTIMESGIHANIVRVDDAGVTLKNTGLDTWLIFGQNTRIPQNGEARVKEGTKIKFGIYNGEIRTAA